jgi:competence protein ComEC
MNVFSGIPFFRILIPYLIGILLADHLPLKWPVMALIVPLVAALLVLKLPAKKWRQLCLLCCDLFLISAGIYAVQVTRQPPFEKGYATVAKNDSLHVFVLQVHDVPINKVKSYKYEVNVIQTDSSKQLISVTGKLLLYLQKSSTAFKIKAGDYLLVQGRLHPPQAPMNPEEFNYKSYLADRSIAATLYADSLHYKALPALRSSFSIWQLGLDLKQTILLRLRNSELSTAAYGICAALLTGYDDDIERSTVTAFAHSGTLHVLSVSGLHTGLIYAVLIFVFRKFDRKRNYKFTEFLFCTFCLWSFALITGFSAPVLRAVIMFNLLAIGKLFFRNTNRNQLNILATSAFCLLLWNPLLIKDLGFLLSYGAMFGLIYFQPAVQALWQTEQKFLAAIWTSVSASVSATISTLPLTLLFFKQFPIWFALCNLLVVPATFVMLLLAFLLVLGWHWIAQPLNLITKYLIEFISLFDSAGFGFLEGIDFSLWDAFCLTCLLLLVSLTLRWRSASFAIQSLGMLCVWQMCSIYTSFQRKNESEICFFALRKSEGVSVKEKQNIVLNLLDSSAFLFSVQPYLTSCNYPKLSKQTFNLIGSGSELIAMTHQLDSLPNVSLKSVNVLVIGGRFRLRTQHLKSLPNLQWLIMDGTNKPSVVNRTRELCRNFNTQLWVLAESGACVFQAGVENYEIKNWR